MPPSKTGQLGLFGDPVACLPAPAWTEDLLALGARLRHWPLFLGTSSWSFPGWAGLVYPSGVPAGDLAARGLRWYGQHPLLRAAGIDRSYYAPLAAGDYRTFAGQVPDGFRFLAKAERSVTTPPEQLQDFARAAPDAFLSRERLVRSCIAPLLEGLGPGRAGLILQFPPLGHRYRRYPPAFAAGLASLLADLPAGVDYFVEVRNGELLTADYFAALAAAGVAHCHSVHPSAPPLPDQAALARATSAGPLLIRWNLQRDRCYAEAKAEFAPFNRLCAPDPATRQAVVELAETALRAGRTVAVLANNKAEGSAPLTLLEVARALDARLESGTGKPAALRSDARAARP